MAPPPPVALAFGVALAMLLGLAGALLRSRLWLSGRKVGPVSMTSLLSIPKRYLVDVHEVVARDRTSARMHVAIAGGTVAAVPIFELRYLVPLQWLFLDWLLVAALTGMILGGIAFAKRRQWHKRSLNGHLSAGEWKIFSWLLALWGASMLATHGLAMASVRLPLLSWACVALGCFCALLVAARAGTSGKLRHAIAGALHLAFHPRPARFKAGERSTALRPIENPDGMSGVAKPTDFLWNQLLGFDACVECGRCEEVCPAFAAGQPLNPKKLVQDMVVGFSKAKSDFRYTGQGHPGIELGLISGAPDLPIVPNLVAPETLWSCTTCRACVEECPMMIEHVDAIVDLRRHLVDEGELQGPAARALEYVRETDTRTGKSLGDRFDWAAGLPVKRISIDLPVDVLLWAGEAAFDARGQRTLRAFVELLDKAGVDFAVLGDEETDVGDLARRLGDEPTFMRLFTHNKSTLSKYKFARIVTPDPHVLQCLGQEYAALGARWPVEHHTQMLATLIEQGKLMPAALHSASVTFHDPCYLGRYSGEFEAPRVILKAIGAQVSEMVQSGRRSRCCGGGGGAALTDVAGARRIPDMRMADARDTGARTLAVACPQCAVMFEGVAQDVQVVKDVAELLHDAVFAR